MRRLKLVVPALMATALAGIWFVRNPEHRTLDAEARTAAPGRTVQLADGATYFEVSGPDTGRVVVLVHGFSVPSYIWDSTFYALSAEGFRVVRYDLFGRGLSDRPRARYDGPFFDAQLAGLLDSIGARLPVDLVGLSFGGFVVAHFASTHSARVRTVTFVDPVTTPRVLPWFIRAPGVGAYLWQTMVVPGMAEGQASDFLHPEHFPDWAGRYRPQMQFRGFGRALRRSALSQASVDFRALHSAVAQANIPVLLIWGRQDQTLAIAGAEPMRAAIPALEFFPVDSAGHLPHMEQAPLVRARMLAFLRR